MIALERIGSSAFPVIDTAVETSDPEFGANNAAWKPVLERHEEALQIAASQGHSIYTERHSLRGQLLARDRVSLLLDDGSPFLELCSFAGHGLPDSSPSASLVCGIGLVSGIATMVIAHIPTLSGGAWNEYTVLKQNRTTEIATENGLPIIALVQSAGVFLPQQFRVFHKGGQIFRDLAIRTKNGHSSCAVVFGSSTAGGAYHPALSDHTIFVKHQARVFLGGPPLVKMATGEVTDAEELGGADMHTNITGLSDQIARDEFEAIRMAREWVSAAAAARCLLQRTQAPSPPRYNIEDIMGIVNPDIRQPFNMKEVIIRLADDSRFKIFKPDFGKGMITGWCYIHGYLTGIVANQTPVIFTQEADKAAQFVQVCNQGNTPIIFLHNVTGFMVGLKAERDGIIRKGARLVSTISTSSVPHISVICGASYGAGNYAMCGRAYKPRFLFTWPIGRCSVMGPDQLGGVMDQISSSSRNAGTGAPAEVPRPNVRESAQQDSDAYRTSSHLLDDGVIDPRDTRDVLGMCLEIVAQPSVKGSDTFRALARM
ncbi:propionyl-CoA carboxylase beta chain [Thozetella sp. PMI_491]|nr:propionyl-CoA carboxylase beta chain [Thozetella sp. PMI_491]